MTQNDLKKLAEFREEWCVSIYMPADPGHLQYRKGTIRLRNILGDVEKALRQKGMRPPEIQKMLETAHALVDDSDFWRNQFGGLAMFIARTHFSHYRVDTRFKQFLLTGKRFHLKPLMKANRNSDAFYVLALSQNKVQLMKGQNDAFDQVDLGNVPASLEEAIRFEEGGKQLQHHVVPRARGGGGQAIYHGHGSAFPDEKEAILQFFKKLDTGVRNILKDDICPLVLMGVDYIRALYHQASEYPLIMEAGISGNMEGIKMKTLYERAQRIAEPHFNLKEEKALEQYNHNRMNTRTSNVLETILPAALHGQVETLFVREDAVCFGSFDEENLEISLHDGQQEESEDLIDFACVHTYINGGDVFFLEGEAMPEEAEIAASFYYQLESV